MLTIKNYKQLEGWAHNYKEFMIGEIIETETEYSFRVGYNKIPYIIKIFRNGTEYKEYEMELSLDNDCIHFLQKHFNDYGDVQH